MIGGQGALVGARPGLSVAEEFAEAVRLEVNPWATIRAHMQRLGARPIDADGTEAAARFRRQHKDWCEAFDAPRIAGGVADGTSDEDRVAATRAQIALAADWARAGRVDVGMVLLDLLELGSLRSLSWAAPAVGLILEQARCDRAAQKQGA